MRHAGVDNKIFSGSLLTREYFIICSYRANALHEYFVLIQFISINLWLTKYECHVLRKEYLRESHTGATQALTRVRERCFVCSDSEIVHYYRFSSVFGLWHKANSAHF